MRNKIIFELDALVSELYRDEINFNNADVTSNQRVHQEHEIKTLIKELAKEW